MWKLSQKQMNELFDENFHVSTEYSSTTQKFVQNRSISDGFRDICDF